MIIYVSLLTIILSVMITINNWSVNRSSIFLSGLLLIISIFALNQHFLASSQSRFWLAFVFNNFAPIWYLSGPLLYWYTRSVVQDEIRFHLTDGLHLIPFFAHLIGILPYLFTTFEFKLQVADQLINNPASLGSLNLNWLIPIEVNLIARPALLIFYCVLSLITFQIYSLKNFQPGSLLLHNLSKNFRRWFFSFTGILLLISINFLITGLQFTGTPENTGDLNQLPLAIFNSGLIAVLPILLLIFPDVTYGLPRMRKRLASSGEAKEKSEESAQTKSYSIDTETTDSYFKDLAVQIINAFEIDQIFLKPDLSADELGEKLSSPRHHIYYCLNTVIGEKFTVLKAKYRVLHAQKLLLELDLNRFTIDSIGQQCGFSSRSSFYAAFREITGITPGDYLAKNGRTAVS